MSENSMQVSHWRVQLLMYGLLAMALIIFGWTVSFQFLPERDELTKEGDLYQGVWLEIKPPRGLIYDP